MTLGKIRKACIRKYRSIVEKLPCEECIKFPLCYNTDYAECKELYDCVSDGFSMLKNCRILSLYKARLFYRYGNNEIHFVRGKELLRNMFYQTILYKRPKYLRFISYFKIWYMDGIIYGFRAYRCVKGWLEKDREMDI